MKLKLVYGCLPVIILFTKLVPNRLKALNLGFIVIFSPEYAHDSARIEHELTHVKQWYRSCGLFWLLYLLPVSRLKYECEAHAKEIKARYPTEYSSRDVYLSYVKNIGNNYALQYKSIIVERCLRSYLFCQQLRSERSWLKVSPHK
jgi:hypothetical protein